MTEEEECEEDTLILEVERKLITEVIKDGDLSCSGSVCDGTRPHIWVIINFSNLDESKLDRLFEAQRLLREAGVLFDSGFGCYGRDWYFDWSMTGAKVYLCNNQPGMNPELDAAAKKIKERRNNE